MTTSTTPAAAPATTSAPASDALAESPLLKRRFVALDAFRGLTIAGMILVNTPGSWSYVYAPLRHSEWHGATPTDLVFPFFLFIVGVAMWFSFAKYDHRPTPAALRKTARRVVIIFAIGMLVLNGFPYVRDYSTLRIMGVLQRIALAYGLGALLCLYLKPRQLVVAAAGILVGYWLLLWGFGGADPYGLETNLPRRVDLFVFGENHVYKGFGVPFDPEGLLSTLPAAVTVVLGYLTGRLIRSEARLEDAVLKMLLAGTALIFGGMVWDLAFPINKPLWTSSYVLYTGGIAMVCLAWFVWLIDVKGYKAWTQPLRVYGMNPLFVYVLSIFWVLVLIYWVRIPTGGGETTSGYGWLYRNVFAALAGPMNGSLLFALAHVVFFWFVAWVLYRKRIFIKI
ncbi:acyltransferase family protein [Rhodocaloribacter sp.]